MGSTRLPGKVLLTLHGRSILTYLVERLRQTKCLDHVVVATTVHPGDDIIVEECLRQLNVSWKPRARSVLNVSVEASTTCSIATLGPRQ